MSATHRCSTDSLIPQQVSIGFAVGNGIIFLFVMIYSFLKLMSDNKQFNNSRISTRIIMWIKDVWKRRGCFIPILTHLADQITDFAVAFEFAEIASSTTSNDCGGINMWYLFGLTVLSIVSYRIISSYMVYDNTKSIIRSMNQLLDFELYRALYINYILDKAEPCDPQRWITEMEAVFESSPQALIQMIYLSKTRTWNESIIVVISFVWSIISVITKSIATDKRIVQRGKEITKEPLWYLIRYLWRFCDVSSRIFIWCLIWLSMGGTTLTIIITVEILLLFTTSIRNKQWSYMFSLVLLPNNLFIFLYRYISNLLILGLIQYFISTNFSCWRCPSFDERRSVILDDEIIFIIYIYSWIAAFMICLKCIIPFDKEASSSRSIAHMVKSKDWNGLKEMQMYIYGNIYWMDTFEHRTHEIYPNKGSKQFISYWFEIRSNEKSDDNMQHIKTLRNSICDTINTSNSSDLVKKIVKCYTDIDVANMDAIVLPSERKNDSSLFFIKFIMFLHEEDLNDRGADGPMTNEEKLKPFKNHCHELYLANREEVTRIIMEQYRLSNVSIIYYREYPSEKKQSKSRDIITKTTETSLLLTKHRKELKIAFDIIINEMELDIVKKVDTINPNKCIHILSSQNIYPTVINDVLEIACNLGLVVRYSKNDSDIDSSDHDDEKEVTFIENDQLLPPQYHRQLITSIEIHQELFGKMQKGGYRTEEINKLIGVLREHNIHHIVIEDVLYFATESSLFERNDEDEQPSNMPDIEIHPMWFTSNRVLT